MGTTSPLPSMMRELTAENAVLRSEIESIKESVSGPSEPQPEYFI